MQPQPQEHQQQDLEPEQQPPPKKDAVGESVPQQAPACPPAAPVSQPEAGAERKAAEEKLDPLIRSLARAPPARGVVAEVRKLFSQEPPPQPADARAGKAGAGGLKLTGGMEPSFRAKTRSLGGTGSVGVAALWSTQQQQHQQQLQQKQQQQRVHQQRQQQAVISARGTSTVPSLAASTSAPAIVAAPGSPGRAGRWPPSNVSASTSAAAVFAAPAPEPDAPAATSAGLPSTSPSRETFASDQPSARTRSLPASPAVSVAARAAALEQDGQVRSLSWLSATEAALIAGLRPAASHHRSVGSPSTPPASPQRTKASTQRAPTAE